MIPTVKRPRSYFYYSAAIPMAFLLTVSLASADDNKKPAPPPAKPAAKSAAPAAKSTAPAAGAAKTATTHGPTTSSPGGAPNALHPTTANPRPTTANPHPTTAAPGTRAPVGAGTNGPVGNRATAGAVRAPGNVVRTRNGAEVRMRPGGRPGDVHLAGRGMDIHHGLDGRRRVEVERADHSRIYAERGGRGYYSRPYMYHGREFAHRTYYYGGRPYDRFYNRYPYHGVYVEVYSPRFYYAPAFYTYAYYPWAAPVVFAPAAWGWVGNPWYGYYGFYFAPYPVYASPAFWLTDYLISTSLANAYAAQAQANAAAAAQAQAGGPVMLTPEVKNEIAEEVRQQVALENDEAQAHARGTDPDPASSGIQRILTDGKQHVFVAGRALDVTDANGAECALSEGDALQLSAPPPPDGTAATLVVLASKGGVECGRGATVSVAVADLQEMQNHMRETIADGLQQMQAKQGQGGMPPIPAPAKAPPTEAFPADAPGPDPNAAAEINKQYQEADEADKEALNQVPAGGPSAASADASSQAPAAPPATLSMGLTIDQVVASQGNPKSIVDLGAKKIYVYPNLKITFMDGKVTDIQ